MSRRIAIFLLALMALGMVSQQVLACSATTPACCGGDGAHGGHGPCDTPAVPAALACSQATCVVALNPALGASPQTRQQFERVEFQPLDPAPFPHLSLAISAKDPVDLLPATWADSLRPELFAAAPAAYLRTLRLRL